jgi:hypothetical protein
MLNAPLYKVELRDGCLNLCAFGVWNFVLKLFRSTKRIEKFFAVPIEARLVRAVNGKRLAVRSRVREVLLLRVIGNEPLKLS